MTDKAYREYIMGPTSQEKFDDMWRSLMLVKIMDRLGLMVVSEAYSAAAHDEVRINIDGLLYAEDIHEWKKRF